MISTSPIIIANWKMHFTLEDAKRLCKVLDCPENCCDTTTLIIAPPTPYIAYLKATYERLNFCAQDVSVKLNFGSYTGENSVNLFKSCQVDYAIVGHSERRSLFNESNGMIRQKAQNCVDNNITPIICVGETIELRENGNYKEFLINQLKESLPHFSNNNSITHITKIIIAYEPIWAIGTKIIPSNAQIAEIFQMFHRLATTLDYEIQLVYGGSVNSGNCKDILQVPNIAGLLVGSASLHPEELLKILNL